MMMGNGVSVGAVASGALVGVMGVGWGEEAQAVRAIAISTQNSERFAKKHLDIASPSKSSTHDDTQSDF
jgi:hypothetical protein